MTKIVLTGATGFAGARFVEQVLTETDLQIISLERKPRVSWDERITIIPWDFLNAPLDDFVSSELMGAKFFVHFAACVHGLRSLTNPEEFIQGNTIGTFNTLELARKVKPELFVYISTAEVLGGKESGYSLEDDPLKPSNPYAASKAAGELLTQTWHRCYGLPVIICRSMNLYDMDTQTDESKFVPMVKKILLAGESVKIHVKNGKPGVRQWMVGTTFAHELLKLLSVAELGLIYHRIGEEMTNLEVAQKVAEHLKVPLKCTFERLTKTHEWRYAVQSTR